MILVQNANRAKPGAPHPQPRIVSRGTGLPGEVLPCDGPRGSHQTGEQRPEMTDRQLAIVSLLDTASSIHKIP